MTPYQTQSPLCPCVDTQITNHCSRLAQCTKHVLTCFPSLKSVRSTMVGVRICHTSSQKSPLVLVIGDWAAMKAFGMEYPFGDNEIMCRVKFAKQYIGAWSSREYRIPWHRWQPIVRGCTQGNAGCYGRHTIPLASAYVRCKTRQQSQPIRKLHLCSLYLHYYCLMNITLEYLYMNLQQTMQPLQLKLHIRTIIMIINCRLMLDGLKNIQNPMVHMATPCFCYSIFNILDHTGWQLIASLPGAVARQHQIYSLIISRRLHPFISTCVFLYCLNVTIMKYHWLIDRGIYYNLHPENWHCSNNPQP